MRWGFTGSQKGCSYIVIERELKRLNFKKGDTVVTGACVGIDSQIFHFVKRNYPEVTNLVIVPADLSKVDQTTYINRTDVIYMEQGTSYRDRNTRIVKEAEKVVAFWTGKKRSGTFMTMNIARRAGKLYETIEI